MSVLFPIPYNFGTESQLETAWARMSDGTISVCFLEASLISIGDRLVPKASISTFDSQPCWNTYTVNKTNKLVSSQIVFTQFTSSLANVMHCLIMLMPASSCKLCRSFLAHNTVFYLNRNIFLLNKDSGIGGNSYLRISSRVIIPMLSKHIARE